MVRLILVVIFATAAVVIAGSAGGQEPAPAAKKTVHVKGYYKKDGTWVPAHDRAAPRSKGGVGPVQNGQPGDPADDDEPPAEKPKPSTPATTTSNPPSGDGAMAGILGGGCCCMVFVVGVALIGGKLFGRTAARSRPQRRRPTERPDDGNPFA